VLEEWRRRKHGEKIIGGEREGCVIRAKHLFLRHYCALINMKQTEKEEGTPLGSQPRGSSGNRPKSPFPDFHEILVVVVDAFCDGHCAEYGKASRSISPLVSSGLCFVSFFKQMDRLMYIVLLRMPPALSNNSAICGSFTESLQASSPRFEVSSLIYALMDFTHLDYAKP
jgi:hypothetical protein